LNDYLIHVKSTIDKTMNDLVTSLSGQFTNLQGVDVDNLVETDEIFKSTDPVILWQFLSLRGAPRDPLYRVDFLVGAKTVSDASNYILTQLSNELRKAFEVETRIVVGDYSGATATENTGYFTIVDNSLAPQQYEHMSGVRFFSIRAMGARNI
jgi:hypothetical protein